MFSLGVLCMTQRVSELFNNEPDFKNEVLTALCSYRNCDWGITSDEDKLSNDAAVENGDDRILAAYSTSKGKIWIITEWDNSATTILFPDEY